MIVETETGSRYEFDLQARTVRRCAGAASVELRKDAEVCPLILMALPVVGESLVFYLDVRGDSVETMRTTSPVVSVTP